MRTSSSGGEKTPRKLSEEELKLMAESGYSKKAIEIYVNNVNVGTLENPSVVTTFLGPCGDLIKLYLKIGKKRQNRRRQVLLFRLPRFSNFSICDDYTCERQDY